ncbi:hypothetical protein [Nostoc sp.]|uniref:hypothetical protein n=1 Tax=Nostoc sp. TaxID=1180 RepID=UPI002FFC3573
MLKIRDLDCQQSYLESLNDEEVENLVRGAGTTIIIASGGTAAVYDDTGSQIATQINTGASITADALGNKIATGGTLIQVIVKPIRKK